MRKGYNAGGSGLDNSDQYYTYDKEEVTAYEASSRSSLLDQRLDLNANAFFNQYTGYQAILGCASPISPRARATAWSWKPRVTPRLTLSAGLGLLDTKVTASDAANPGIQGNQFNYAPHLTVNLGFKQRLDHGLFVGGA